MTIRSGQAVSPSSICSQHQYPKNTSFVTLALISQEMEFLCEHLIPDYKITVLIFHILSLLKMMLDSLGNAVILTELCKILTKTILSF